jgi:fatty acid desaturase
LGFPFYLPQKILNPATGRSRLHTYQLVRADMKNDDLRADRDELDHFVPRTPAKRSNNLVMQVAAGVFLGGLALWLVQLAATMLYAKLMLATVTFGG